MGYITAAKLNEWFGNHAAFQQAMYRYIILNEQVELPEGTDWDEVIRLLYNSHSLAVYAIN